MNLTLEMLDVLVLCEQVDIVCTRHMMDLTGFSRGRVVSMQRSLLHNKYVTRSVLPDSPVTSYTYNVTDKTRRLLRVYAERLARYHVQP